MDFRNKKNASTGLSTNGYSDFRSARGFTLIEVLLSLAIIGLVLTPIFLIQSTVLRTSSASAHLFTRLMYAKDFLIDQQFEHSQESAPAQAELKITAPATTLKFDSQKIPENSALKKIKNVMVESVTMEWTDARNKKRREKLVTFAFKPEGKHE